MSFYLETYFESVGKYNEELCGDKVEIVRNDQSVILVLADGLGSGVKANILATLTTKIIGTMMANGSDIDEAVETIASTLPVCREREIAYSTFTILQIFNNGEGYLVEFDNPSVFWVKNGRLMSIKSDARSIGGKVVKETRFNVEQDDLFVITSDGVVHAGIGGRLNLGWQWENVGEFIRNAYREDMSSKAITKLLVSASKSLYAQKPGDDVTVAAIKVRRPVNLSLMVGPPVNSEKDSEVVSRFYENDGIKVVCGGTTAQIVARELGKKVVPSFNYFSPSIPPTAEIEGIDLVTEGVLTIRKALEVIRACTQPGSTMDDLLKLDGKDGASRLAKLIMDESTNIHIYVGRAMNPAHQNPEFPVSLSLKLRLVEEMASCLKSIGKQVKLRYC